MSLLRLNDVHLAYGHRPLLDGADLVLERRERVALLGRNGTGKSSLLRVLAGTVQADDGERWIADGLKVSYLPQEVPEADDAPLRAVVARGLSVAHSGGIEEAVFEEDWAEGYRVDAVLSRLGLPGDLPMNRASGGIRRRALLGRALVSEPDLLLLDEPTNHLDIDAIGALEETLLGFPGSLVFVTHDRALIRRLATRILELDRGRLVSFPGAYDTYLARKAAMLEAESRADAQFDRDLAGEEAWIRQGIKARRTRNEGRVRRLEQMRRQRAQRLARPDNVRLAVDSGGQSGRLVVELENVSFAHPEADPREAPTIDDFSTRILRGDRVGIIGPNGCGKSTLLRLMLGELQPTRGTVRLGTRLNIAYFDQQRAGLRLEESVRDNVVEGSDQIEVGGRSRHVVGYLQDFLFSPERINSPVKTLSGGERNRLLLARMFSQPANLLVMDEPTNDLDIETLELLEELLLEYDGTLLLVSHDRAFLDAVVTSTIVFEAGGRIAEYVGGYADWLRQRPPAAEAGDAAVKRRSQTVAKEPQGSRRRTSRRPLGFNETRELAALPDRIAALEAEQESLQARMSDPEFYQQSKEQIAAVVSALDQLTRDIEAAFERWAALEAQQ